MKLLRLIVLLVFSTAMIAGCAAKKASASVKLPKNAILLDVRTPEEFKSAHLPGAINIPHTGIAEKISTFAPDKTAPLYLYCRSGRRVGVAMEMLAKAGYSAMVNLGGMKEAAKKLNLKPIK